MGLGRISEALQDFTGGVIEMINLQTPPADGSPDVYKVLQKAHERHSLMGASIEVGVCFLKEFEPKNVGVQTITSRDTELKSKPKKSLEVFTFPRYGRV